MKAVLLSTWALMVGFAFTILSMGLQGPLVTVRAFDEGFDTSDTGLIMAGLFAGYLLGALTTPRIVRHVGHAKVFAAAASIASGTALLFASFVDPVVWFVLRFITGSCLAAIFIVAEAWLNQSSPNQVRGKVLNLYIMLCYGGLGVGALLLNLSDPRGYDLFILASVLISFGIVPVLLSAKPAPAFEAPKRLGVIALFRKAPLGVGAIFMTGMIVGALVGAGPIYADKSGLTTVEISVFMAVMFLGSQVFLWPVGILVDRYDRARVMIVIGALAAVAAALLAVTPVDRELLVFLLIGLFSGLCFSFYGICSAITNDVLEPDEMVGGGMTLFVCSGIGNVLGPIVSTEIIEAWQPSAYFYFLFAVSVMIVLYAVIHLVRRGSVPAARRRPTGSSAIWRSLWMTPSRMAWSSRPEREDD